MNEKRYIADGHNVVAIRGEVVATTGYLPNSKDVKGLVATKLPFAERIILTLVSTAMNQASPPQTTHKEALTLSEVELTELAKNYLTPQILRQLASELDFEQEIEHLKA